MHEPFGPRPRLVSRVQNEGKRGLSGANTAATAPRTIFLASMSAEQRGYSNAPRRAVEYARFRLAEAAGPLECRGLERKKFVLSL